MWPKNYNSSNEDSHFARLQYNARVREVEKKGWNKILAEYHPDNNLASDAWKTFKEYRAIYRSLQLNK
jgi:DnaJ-class molecular chaperone